MSHDDWYCCVCYATGGPWITDMNGDEWDIHRGECARYAGLPDDGFDPTPPPCF